MQEKLVELVSLLLDFGRIERKTFHQDGTTPESDTTHTVMLATIGCAFAKELYPTLDLGLVSQFALVHDLVEVYAGDTDVLSMTKTNMLEEKQIREHAALLRITKEFGQTTPWLHQTIEKYERLDTPEAQYVFVLDKLIAKVTVYLNKAKGINDNHLTTRAVARPIFERQTQRITPHAQDFPDLMKMWHYFVAKELEFISE